MTLPATVLAQVVRAYRRLPRADIPRCRYHPTCSAYALTALDRHGAARGAYLSARRILRCHPLRPGGIDEVPETFALRTQPQRRTA